MCHHDFVFSLSCFLLSVGESTAQQRKGEKINAPLSCFLTMLNKRTDFASRIDALATIGADEEDRLWRLGEAIEAVRPKLQQSRDPAPSTLVVARGSSALLRSSSLVTRGAVQSGLGGSNFGSIQGLQMELDSLRRANESLRGEVFQAQQTLIHRTRERDRQLAAKSEGEALQSGLEQLHESLRECSSHWRDRLNHLRSDRASFTDARRTLSAELQARERDLDAQISAQERKLAEVRRRSNQLRQTMESEEASLSSVTGEVETLSQQWEECSGSRRGTLGTLEDEKNQLQRSISTIQEQIAASSAQQQKFLNAYTAKFIAASMFAPADRLPPQMEMRMVQLRDARGKDDVTRLSEAMALLKSTIVHFDTDVKHLRSVQRLAEAELENAFKASHNEIKVVVTMCLPKDEVRRFARGGHTFDEWPLTQTMLEESFPAHKLEIVHHALQDMVVAWDGMSVESKARMTTAQDVVSNAHLLFMIACYVSLKRAQKWALKYQQMLSNGWR